MRGEAVALCDGDMREYRSLIDRWERSKLNGDDADPRRVEAEEKLLLHGECKRDGGLLERPHRARLIKHDDNVDGGLAQRGQRRVGRRWHWRRR